MLLRKTPVQWVVGISRWLGNQDGLPVRGGLHPFGLHAVRIQHVRAILPIFVDERMWALLGRMACCLLLDIRA